MYQLIFGYLETRPQNLAAVRKEKKQWSQLDTQQKL